jgi:hypothetical protein
MNSNSTTLPRNDDNVTVCPFKPFDVTTGNTKSGATLCAITTTEQRLRNTIRRKLEIANLLSI